MPIISTMKMTNYDPDHINIAKNIQGADKINDDKMRKIMIFIIRLDDDHTALTMMIWIGSFTKMTF